LSEFRATILTVRKYNKTRMEDNFTRRSFYTIAGLSTLYVQSFPILGKLKTNYRNVKIIFH